MSQYSQADGVTIHNKSGHVVIKGKIKSLEVNGESVYGLQSTTVINTDRVSYDLWRKLFGVVIIFLLGTIMYHLA